MTRPRPQMLDRKQVADMLHQHQQLLREAKERGDDAEIALHRIASQCYAHVLGTSPSIVAMLLEREGAEGAKALQELLGNIRAADAPRSETTH